MVQRSLEETRKNTVTIEATQRLHQQQKAAFKEQSLLLANLRAQLTVITRQLHAQRSELEAEKALGLQQTKDLRALETILRNEGIDGVEERDRKISHDELRHLESELEAAARDCDREVTATQKLELTATELLGLEKDSCNAPLFSPARPSAQKFCCRPERGLPCSLFARRTDCRPSNIYQSIF